MAAQIADRLAKADVTLKANEFVAIQFLAVMIAMMIDTVILRNLGLAPVKMMISLIFFIFPNVMLVIDAPATYQMIESLDGMGK